MLLQFFFVSSTTGKRKIRRYNRNAAYEQELHREANRRAVVRAKRQASSKARERLQQQQRDLSQDGDNDDNLLDETWELSENKGTSGAAKKSHQHAPSRNAGNKNSSKNSSTAQASGKLSSSAATSSTSGLQQHKEDYESDVENVPDDLAAEMVSDDNGTPGSRKKKSRSGKFRGRRDENDQDGVEGQDTSCLEVNLDIIIIIICSYLYFLLITFTYFSASDLEDVIPFTKSARTATG